MISEAHFIRLFCSGRANGKLTLKNRVKLFGDVLKNIFAESMTNY